MDKRKYYGFYAIVIGVILILTVMLIGCNSKANSSEEVKLSSANIGYSTEDDIVTTEEVTAPTTIYATTEVSGKIAILENIALSKENAESLVLAIIKEYYSQEVPLSISPDTYIFDQSGSIKNEAIKNQLEQYTAYSDSPAYYESMCDTGTYCSVTGLNCNEIVLFEMDNGHFALSEPYSDITDYSMKYPYLFTVRSSDNSCAYYWCAQQESNIASYASHRCVRIWTYDKERNTYACIWEA